MASHKKSDVKNSHHDLDRIMANYAFMDEGLAEWETKKVLYALCKLAVYDTDMPKTTIGDIQKNKDGGTSCNHERYSSTDFTKIFTWH
jgi:hypothetical protein